MVEGFDSAGVADAVPHAADADAAARCGCRHAR